MLSWLLIFITMEHTDDNTTIIGTISGTLLSVGVTIDHQDYLKTIVLAAVGAAVSFVVSVVLKWVWRRILSRGKNFILLLFSKSCQFPQFCAWDIKDVALVPGISYTVLLLLEIPFFCKDYLQLEPIR